MHTIRPFALATLLILGAAPGGAGGTLASAEDEAPAASPAEQAFKDAWWAETGGGNLNEALALYEKAAAAEGPAAVKAKALYRRALVLQRIGKTEEAIQTLERLAKEHAGETQLQTDARARLEEWTAVDLRTGFPEWYRRFQYGPEFQAKVLDLVLKLGTGDPQASSLAERELLTIGEPSIGALRAHLGSRNETLQQNAVKVLLQLGVVPDEVTRRFGAWTVFEACWGPIFDLPTERRAALRSQLTTEVGGEAVDALKAVLDGPDAVLAWLADLRDGVEGRNASVRYAVQSHLLKRIANDDAASNRVQALVRQELPSAGIWMGFARWLIQRRRVTRADVEAWTALPYDTSAVLLTDAVRDGQIFQPMEGLELLRRLEDLRPQGQYPISILHAWTTLLPTLPWPESREPSARLLASLWPTALQYSNERPVASERVLEVFALAFEQESEPKRAIDLLGYWITSGASRPGGIDRLVGWVRKGPSANHRSLAISTLASRMPAENVTEAMALLLEEGVPASEVLGRWGHLLANWSGAERLRQSREHLGALLERVRQEEERGDMGFARELLDRLVGPTRNSPSGVTPFVERWLEAPERFPMASVQASNQLGTMAKALASGGDLPGIRRRFMERWKQANEAQRVGLLRGLDLLDGKNDPELGAFWREVLTARPQQYPLEQRGRLILQVGQSLTLDDVRAWYDLTQPAEVDLAAEWWTRHGAPLFLGSAEAFDALRLAFRPEGPMADQLAPRFESIEAVWRPLAAMLLVHKEAHTRVLGVQFLLRRSAPEDSDLWAAALRDTSVEVRVLAAKSMERVPTPTTIKALVVALDDAHPDVRAAALGSLDAIQKMEDLKARWREKVR